MRFLSPFLSILLAPLLACGPVLGQSPAAAAAAAPAELHIAHRDEAKPGTSLSVQVTDEAGAPVAGASVVFHLAGPLGAGSFANGTESTTVQTDATGQAQANIARWAPGSGSASVVVTANKGASHAGLLFDQRMPSAGKPVAAPSPQPVALPATVPVQAMAAPKAAPVARTPGVMVENSETSPAVEQRGAESATTAASLDDSPYANVPIRHMFGPDSAPAGVSVLNGKSYGESAGHGGKMKWVIAIAAAAGAGAAFALLHKGSGSSNAASGVSIGSPSISVGHP